MTINLNLDGVEAWSGGGGALPDGDYWVKITDADEGRSKGGYPQIELELEVIAGDLTGSSTRDWVVITENSLGRVRALLEAANLEIPPGQFSLDAVRLVGRSVEIVVRSEVHGGKKRSRVKAYQRIESDVPSDSVPIATGASAKDEEIPF